MFFYPAIKGRQSVRCASVYGSVGSILQPDSVFIFSVPQQGLIMDCESDKRPARKDNSPDITVKV